MHADVSPGLLMHSPHIRRILRGHQMPSLEGPTRHPARRPTNPTLLALPPHAGGRHSPRQLGPQNTRGRGPLREARYRNKLPGSSKRHSSHNLRLVQTPNISERPKRPIIVRHAGLPPNVLLQRAPGGHAQLLGAARRRRIRLRLQGHPPRQDGRCRQNPRKLSVGVSRREAVPHGGLHDRHHPAREPRAPAWLLQPKESPDACVRLHAQRLTEQLPFSRQKLGQHAAAARLED
eukprot:TRINITY_DN782_c0_g2_i1.p2 TRINITY_DN782_c0_g2~~TRINITY_DN782_c0_g2_i1.p2  ORF type:complete len:234 (-),score=-20.96 TRINITY_DN782_c0_g2_i1:811-1512(-)